MTLCNDCILGLSDISDLRKAFCFEHKPSVRKQHNAGYKHKANVREYYQQFEQSQTQSLIDQKIKEHLGQAGMYQIGGVYNQQLASLPGMQRPPRLPILPPPGLPPAMMPGFRPPPMLLRPGVPGYGMPPQMAQIPGQPPMQANGMLPRPPTMSAAPEGMPIPSSTNAPPGITQSLYQPNLANAPPPPASAPTDSYAFAPAPGAAH